MRIDHLVIAMAVPVCAAGMSLFSGGSLDAGEAIAAAIIAAITGVYAIALYRSAQSSLQLQARALPALARATLAIVPQSVRVGRAFLAAIRARPDSTVGHPAPQPFRPGADDPADAGRRAVVVLAQSLAPNGFVLEQRPEDLLMHQLLPQAPSPDREWPV